MAQKQDECQNGICACTYMHAHKKYICFFKRYFKSLISNKIEESVVFPFYGSQKLICLKRKKKIANLAAEYVEVCIHFLGPPYIEVRSFKIDNRFIESQSGHNFSQFIVSEV